MSGTRGASRRSEYRWPLFGLFHQRAPCGDHARGHPVGREARRRGAPVDPPIPAAKTCGATAARQASRSQGRQADPSIPASATACAPTGVPNAGTSHADASITASPMPSFSDGTTTALAALTQ